MQRPSYEEVIKLIEETRAAAIAYDEMMKKRITTYQEQLERDRLMKKAVELNKKRIEVLSMFSEEEREEIRRLAQSKQG